MPGGKSKKWPWILGIIAAFLVGVGIGGSGSDEPTTTSTATADTAQEPTVTVTATAPAPVTEEADDSEKSSDADTAGAAAGPDDQATGQLPIQNGDWRLDAVSLKRDFVGDFDARARVTYTGSDPEGGDNSFTLTVFKNGRDVGSMTGFANTVLPGKTVTVNMLSTDKFVKGPWTYDFQNDW